MTVIGVDTDSEKINAARQALYKKGLYGTRISLTIGVVAVALFVIFWGQWSATAFGIVMAVASGAITSALGYALWYRCLRQLSATSAAVVQLTVPAIATLGGILLASISGVSTSLALVALAAFPAMRAAMVA